VINFFSASFPLFYLTDYQIFINPETLVI